MPVDNDSFRAALGRFGSGITVVTTRDRDGRPRGVTVTSFASLSLVPPRVLVCLGSPGQACDAVRAAGRYVAHVLGEGQEEVSRRFARPGVGPEAFDGLAVRAGLGGLPVLSQAIAVVECRVVEVLPGGDHAILVGEVEATSVADGRPLLYFRGGYGRLA